jgi:hypothetical protein
MTGEELMRLAERVAEEWRNDPIVLGVGFGIKERGGERVAGPALCFTVRRKYASEAEIRAAGSRPIPDEVEGVATDVNVVEQTASKMPVGNRGTSVQEPLAGGVSTAVLGGFFSFPTGYGTLGGVCTHDSDGKLMALSNAHVWGSDIGSDIVQPFVPVGEFVEGAVKLLTCGPVVSYITEGELPSGLTAVLSAAAAGAWVAAAASDVKDPHRRGEEATVPAQPAELTSSELVRFTAEPDRPPMPGTPYQADVAFTFERHTDRATYPFDVQEQRANEHLLVRKHLWTDLREYPAGRTVELYALLETARAISPDAFHVVAHLSPVDQPERRVTRVLQPAPCERVPFRCVGFPYREPDETAEFPFESQGLGYRAGYPGIFRDQWPPQGTIELQFPGDGLEIDIPPSARVDVRLVQFSSDQITLDGYESDGTLASTVATDGTQGAEHVLTVRGRELTRLVLQGGANEALLLEVCLTLLRPGEPEEEPGEPVEAVQAVAGPRWRTFCYRGRFTLDPAESPGSWLGLLSAQTVNTTPPGTPPAEAAQVIGGIESADIASVNVATCLLVLALDDLFDVI